MRAASKKSVVSLSFGGDGAVLSTPTNATDVGALRRGERSTRRTQGGWTLRHLREGFCALPAKRRLKGNITSGEAFDQLWHALNRWMKELLEEGRGVNVHNFARFSWQTHKPYIGEKGKGRYAKQLRPSFELADSFVRQHNILLKAQKTPMPLETAPCEDINFTKLAIRFTDNLSKDAMFSGMRDVLRILGRAIGATQTQTKVAIDFDVGTLFAKQRKVWFVFDRELEYRFMPKGSPQRRLLSSDRRKREEAERRLLDEAAVAAAAAVPEEDEPASKEGDADGEGAASNEGEEKAADSRALTAEEQRLAVLRAAFPQSASFGPKGACVMDEEGGMRYRESSVIEAAHERHVGRLKVGVVVALEEREEFKQTVIRRRLAAEAKAAALKAEAVAHQDFLLGQINDTTTVRAAAPDHSKTAPCVFPAMHKITKAHNIMDARSKKINYQNKADLERIIDERDDTVRRKRDELMTRDMADLERWRLECVCTPFSRLPAFPRCVLAPPLAHAVAVALALDRPRSPPPSAATSSTSGSGARKKRAIRS